MDKTKILKWVQKGMPVKADGKNWFLHAAGTMDPSGQYCLVCDKNAYAPDHDGSTVTVSAVEVKNLTIDM